MKKYKPKNAPVYDVIQWTGDNLEDFTSRHRARDDEHLCGKFEVCKNDSTVLTCIDDLRASRIPLNSYVLFSCGELDGWTPSLDNYIEVID